MFLDINGPDLFRLQSAPPRAADPLDPGVLFSGGFDDGQVFVFQQAIANSGVGYTSNAIDFGQTFANVPLVFGGLKLSQAVVQDGAVRFNTGEIVAPCAYQYTRYNVGRVINWEFSFITTKTGISINSAGFNGVATFLVLDL